VLTTCFPPCNTPYALVDCPYNRVRITLLLRQLLCDWILLATEANKFPVPMHTIVPGAPHILGAADASKNGMGGCWTTIDTTGQQANYLWCTSFPEEIQKELVSVEPTRKNHKQ
jgi:hypothetical protein